MRCFARIWNKSMHNSFSTSKFEIFAYCLDCVRTKSFAPFIHSICSTEIHNRKKLRKTSALEHSLLSNSTSIKYIKMSWIFIVIFQYCVLFEKGHSHMEKYCLQFRNELKLQFLLYISFAIEWFSSAKYSVEKKQEENKREAKYNE